MRPTPPTTLGRWPLILLAAIVAVAVAVAIFVVSGVGDPRTRSVMVDQFPELAIDDIEIEVASGLPIVPVALADGPWWWVEAPDQALDPRSRFTSAAPISGAVDRAVPGVTLLARFPDHAAARSVAEALAVAVGDPAAEAAWLVGAGRPGGGSFDWLGSAAATAPFVQVVDRWLLVGGLTYRDSFDAWGTSAAGEPVYRSPLTLALAQLADTVLVEGDRSGEGAVAFDAICRGASDELRLLSQDLADHGLQPRWQPPWIEPGTTEDQRRARRTLRLMRRLQGAAFGRVLLEDPEFGRLDRALGAAADNGDADRIRAASDDLSAYIVRALPAELPDLGPVAAALDPDIVAARGGQVRAVRGRHHGGRADAMLK